MEIDGFKRKEPIIGVKADNTRIMLTDAQTSLLADLCNSTTIITEEIKALAKRVDRLYSHLGLRG